MAAVALVAAVAVCEAEPAVVWPEDSAEVRVDLRWIPVSAWEEAVRSRPRVIQPVPATAVEVPRTLSIPWEGVRILVRLRTFTP